MAHHVYQSPVFVLGGTNVGEANRFLELLYVSLFSLMTAEEKLKGYLNVRI